MSSALHRITSDPRRVTSRGMAVFLKFPLLLLYEQAAHHEEHDGDSDAQALLDVVDVVPCVSHAEVEHHRRDGSRHQLATESLPHLRQSRESATVVVS